MAEIISVKFKIITNKKRREIKLELTKSTNDDDQIEWSLNFVLGEKEKAEDKDFVEIISFSVMINPELNAKAEATRVKGLTKKQSSQAVLTGEFAKAAADGEVGQESVDIQAVKIIGSR
jgi:hypothetical protein